MRTAIIRRIETAEQAVPTQIRSRIVFMPKGADEAGFLAAAMARHGGAEIHAIEVLSSDVSDDATAAHFLIDAISKLPARGRTHSESPLEFGLDTARRLAFIAARAKREMQQ